MELILNNISQEVNKNTETYDSVLKVWTTALSHFEALMHGTPLNAPGELLLALGAWHLYPDLTVVDPVTKNVQYGDKLLRHCPVVTVGLKPKQPQTGLTWSLPLEKLRHYGTPVQVEKDLRHSQRLSIDELLLAFLGSFLYGWKQYGENTGLAIEWLDNFHSSLEHSEALGRVDNFSLEKFVEDVTSQSDITVSAAFILLVSRQDSWLGLLFRAARYYRSLSSKDRRGADAMLKYGRGHARNFIGIRPSPFIDLFTFGKFIKYWDTEEDGIRFLRDVAEQIDVDGKKIFIRYRHNFTHPWEVKADHTHAPRRSFAYEFATAKKRSITSAKRHLEDHTQSIEGHCRWLYRGGPLSGPFQNRDYMKAFERFVTRNGRSGYLPNGLFWSHSHRENHLRILRCDQYYPISGKFSEVEYEPRAQQFCEQGEFVYHREDAYIEDLAHKEIGLFWPHYSSMLFRQYKIMYGPENSSVSSIDFVPSINLSDDNPWFRQVYGDEVAGLFVTSPEPHYEDREDDLRSNIFMASKIKMEARDAKDVQNFLRSRDYNHHLLAFDFLNSLPPVIFHSDPYFMSLKLISTAASLYNEAKGATVDVRMESGRLDIQPTQLRKTMAMSSADSIFVAKELVQDPAVRDRSCLIRRVAGNVSRPGICFLVPPADPMVAPPSLDDFRSQLYADFDGSFEDNFSKTSLHLSFTTA